jgi:hypothetical protein
MKYYMSSNGQEVGVIFKSDFEKANDKVRLNFVEEVMRGIDSLTSGLGRP